MAKTRHYDYVLIDCPPALGEITANVLCASDYTLLPIDPGDEVDTSGLDSVQSFLDGLKASGNAKADILGFFINKFMKGDPVQEYNMQQISEVYKKWYIPITLPFHKYVSESRFYGLPLAWLHPRCQIGKLFEELATYVNDKTENKEG